MLEEACRTLDELDRLEKALRALPDLVVTGSMGQPRTHPLLGEVREHRRLLERLTTALNLPDITEEIGHRAGQKHAKKAALARWNRTQDGAAAS
jgi:hypothetical protein